MINGLNKLTGCDCLSENDRTVIIDALIIKESLIEDALEESKIEERNLSKIDIRTHVPSSSLQTGLQETVQLRKRVQSTPICR